MPTKTKIAANSRGRPKKTFKIKEKKTSNIKRWRGRPKKDKSIKENDNINTKISKHGQDIKQISQNHKKIHLDIKNSSFSSKKIKKEENTKTDKFALWLLVFSMLLFIFSLYKTFYLVPSSSYNFDEYADKKLNIDTDILIETGGSIIVQDVSQEIQISADVINASDSSSIEDKYGISDIDVINMFYKTINDKWYNDLPYFADNYIKFSSLFKIYYAENWLGNFLSNLTNERVYLTNIEEIVWASDKPWVKYYSYTIKYKLKNNNQLFTEERKAAVVIRNDRKLIWSLQCTNVWCSKMPFFNPERHGIK